jgi:uncharacterized membrane protein YcaP (DUF421 family)
MELMARATVVFFGLIIVLRTLGKRELSQLSAFELLMIVLLGDLAQPAITQEDMSVTGALLAIGTISFWVLAMSYVTFRWPGSQRWLEGQPVIVLRDGNVLEKALQIERIPLAELLAAARQRGIGDLRDVQLGVLEADGQFSFILRHGQADSPSRSRAI